MSIDKPRWIERILNDPLIPDIGYGTETTPDRLELYYDAMVGPSGRATHLFEKLAVQPGGIEEYQTIGQDGEPVTAKFGRVHFVGYMTSPESADSGAPYVSTPKYMNGDALIIKADAKDKIQAIKLEYGNSGGAAWGEVHFLDDKKLAIARSREPDHVYPVIKDNESVLMQIGNAVRIAERKKFLTRLVLADK